MHLPGPETFERFASLAIPIRPHPVGPIETNPIRVPRQSVEVRPVKAREALEPVDRIGTKKYFGVQLDRDRRTEDPGTAAGRLLAPALVWRTVRP